MDGPADGVQGEFGVVRGLVGLVNPGEALDDSGPGFLVQSLDVPFLAFFQWRVDVDLKKRKLVLFMQLSG